MASAASCKAAKHGAVVLPPLTKGTNSALCVWFHGLGDSGEGWAPVMRQLQKQALPHVKFVLPHAPIQPVTVNMGMRMRSWHDIKDLANIEKEVFDGIEESRKLAESIIDEEMKSLAGSAAAESAPPKIMIGGFSQGAALSVFSGLQYAGATLAGIALCSGYMPFKGDVASIIHEKQKKVPIWQGHGTSDALVVPRAGHNCRDRLRAADMVLEFKSYKNMGHETCNDELMDLAAFCKKVLC